MKFFPKEENSYQRNKKRMYIAGYILLGLCILGFCVPSLIKYFGGELNELTVDIKPQELNPDDLENISELSLKGWSDVDSDSDFEGFKLKILTEVTLTLEFDHENADKVNGVPVKASLLDESGNGEETLYGRGYLKDGNLKIYQSDEEIESGYEKSGWLMVEARNIKNLSDFSATIHFYPEDNGGSYNFIDQLTWLKILDSTPTSIYEGPYNSRVEMQMIKLWGEKKKGVKALVFCYNFSIDEEGYDEPMSTAWVLTLMDSDNMILIDSNPMPYLGVAKWENEKLVVTRHGERFEMNLVERHVMMNAEIEESISEMEGWEGQ